MARRGQARVARGRWPLAGCLALLVALAPAVTARVRGDVPSVSADAARDSFQPDQPGLGPNVVASDGFGQQFVTPVSGQVYAQPLVSGRLVVVATEADQVYGIDRAAGAVVWQATVGRPVPSVNSPGQCSQPSPQVGVTSTPVIDPATNTLYVVGRTWDGENAASARYFIHALDLASGGERRGWPLAMIGVADNDQAAVFNPVMQLQRPGLALVNGYVVVAFGAFCDLPPARGFVATVSVTGGPIHFWTDEAGQGNNALGSIWESGGGIVSDGSGQLILSTANGPSPPPSPGKPLTGGQPGALGDSVVRLQLGGDGRLRVADWFSPADASQLNHKDWDLGSAAPAALPDSLGTALHPHLLLQAGKEGRVYLLDRDNLGGNGQGVGGGDAALAETGPNEPILGHPAVWPGDGGWVYLTGAPQPGTQANPNARATLRAYRLAVDPAGRFSLVMSGASTTFGYGSGSPLVTSDGLRSGSAVVWVTEAACRAANGCRGEESTGELRAYAPIPVHGQMLLLARFPLGTQQKFSVPTADHNQLFVATGDGRLLAFGPRAGPGYVQVAADGGVFAFGSAHFYGSPAGLRFSRPAVGLALTPNGRGYWIVAADGGVFAYGDATYFGSTGGQPLHAPIVGITPTITGRGYWLVAADGGIFSFGDADYFGSARALPVGRSIVGMAPTPTGRGYWLVSNSGGVFAFGDAEFFGSEGGQALDAPIVGLAPTTTGMGYWLVASDGGLFANGDAGYFGSAATLHLAQPVVAIVPTAQGSGYWLVGADGGVFAYGNARFVGTSNTLGLAGPIVAMLRVP